MLFVVSSSDRKWTDRQWQSKADGMISYWTSHDYWMVIRYMQNMEEGVSCPTVCYILFISTWLDQHWELTTTTNDTSWSVSSQYVNGPQISVAFSGNKHALIKHVFKWLESQICFSESDCGKIYCLSLCCWPSCIAEFCEIYCLGKSHGIKCILNDKLCNLTVIYLKNILI